MSLRHRIIIWYTSLFAGLSVVLGAFTSFAVARFVVSQEREALAAVARIGLDIVLSSPAATKSGGLQSTVRQFARKAGARVTFIAPDGTVLADSEHDPSTMENHGARPEVIAARRDGWGASVRHSTTTGLDMLYVALADPQRGYVLRLAKPLPEVKRLYFQLFYALLAALLLILLGGAVLSIRIAATFTAPLQNLASVARAIGSGDTAARAPVTGPDEIATLATALNEMAVRLENRSLELVRRTAELQAVLRHMADGLLVTDGQSRVTMCNPAAARLLGFDENKALGQSVLRATGNYSLAEAFERSLATHTTTETEITVRDAGGEKIIQASVTVLEGDGVTQPWAVGVLRDVTEIRRLERVRRDFVASAGHELRTPVAAIRSLAEALSAGAAADPELGPEFLAQIVENTQRLERIVQDLLELARLESVRPTPLQSITLRPVV
ncbi:MAG: HAMP domain-containing protein, partial [Armatimonadetes bacterium]|nr:HAMP domain-containing protein [Armatimonadota bacterium]